MLWNGFCLYRLPVQRFATVFPFRLVTLFCRRKTPVRTLSYWYKPHTSKTKLPVLFIHGIGIGLYTYVRFLADINEGHKESKEDGEIGIIAIEIMPVSFRITGAALKSQDMCDEISRILRFHRWQKAIMVSHSYGSVISSHLLHNRETAELFGPVVLVDPVSILLHLPVLDDRLLC